MCKPSLTILPIVFICVLLAMYADGAQADESNSTTAAVDASNEVVHQVTSTKAATTTLAPWKVKLAQLQEKTKKRQAETKAKLEKLRKEHKEWAKMSPKERVAKRKAEAEARHAELKKKSADRQAQLKAKLAEDAQKRQLAKSTTKSPSQSTTTSTNGATVQQFGNGTTISG